MGIKLGARIGDVGAYPLRTASEVKKPSAVGRSWELAKRQSVAPPLPAAWPVFLVLPGVIEAPPRLSPGAEAAKRPEVVPG